MSLVGGGEEVQRADLGKLDEFVLLEFGNAKDEIVDGREGALGAGADEGACGGFAQAPDVAESEAEGEGSFPSAISSSVHSQSDRITSIGRTFNPCRCASFTSVAGL